MVGCQADDNPRKAPGNNRESGVGFPHTFRASARPTCPSSTCPANFRYRGGGLAFLERNDHQLTVLCAACRVTFDLTETPSNIRVLDYQRLTAAMSLHEIDGRPRWREVRRKLGVHAIDSSALSTISRTTVFLAIWAHLSVSTLNPSLSPRVAFRSGLSINTSEDPVLILSSETSEVIVLKSRISYSWSVHS